MLVQEVMDQAAAILNDTGLDLYTYVAQLPYVKKANEDLEKKLNIYGAPQVRKKSSTISVTAGAVTVTLPSDFLIPLELKERNVGDNDDQWVDMTEQTWEPDSTATTYIEYWAFRNNNIYIKAALQNKEILLYYDRTLGVITSENSLVDFSATKGYLAARTAELCCRFIGMNKTFADEIRDNEVAQAEDDLLRMIVLSTQGNSYRPQKFTTMRIGGGVI